MPPRRSLYGTPGPGMPELPLTRVAALDTAAQLSVQNLPIDAIDPNPFQARTTFDDLDELAAAIRAQGFISRLRVRPHPDQGGRFQLVFGERRLRAAKLAGLQVIPCELAAHTDAELIEIGLAENIQRAALTPMDEARALRSMMDELGYSIRKVAERLGKTKAYIQNRLDLLRLPDDVQQMVEQQPSTFTAAAYLRHVPNAEDRRPVIAAVIRGELGKEGVRDLVQQLTSAAVLPTSLQSDTPIPTAAEPSSTRAAANPEASAAAAPRAPALPPRGPAPSRHQPPVAQHPRAASQEGTGVDRRVVRQSARALDQAKHSVRLLLSQAQTAAAALLPDDRGALRVFLRDDVLPHLELLLVEVEPEV